MAEFQDDFFRTLFCFQKIDMKFKTSRTVRRSFENYNFRIAFPSTKKKKIKTKEKKFKLNKLLTLNYNNFFLAKDWSNNARISDIDVYTRGKLCLVKGNYGIFGFRNLFKMN